MTSKDMWQCMNEWARQVKEGKSDDTDKVRSGGEAIILESSPVGESQSNGHAEQAVGAMKKQIKKTGSRKQLGEALLEYRNTPRVCDRLSLAQWMLGRRQGT